MFLLKGHRAFRNIVLLATCVGALASCERKGTIQAPRPARPDPRVVKAFGEAGSQLCVVPLEYSEGTEGKSVTIHKLDVVVGATRTATATALLKSCEDLGEAGKTVCTGELKKNLYPCVHDSMFVPIHVAESEIQCRLDYDAPIREAETSESPSPPSEARLSEDSPTEDSPSIGSGLSASAATASRVLLVTGKTGESARVVISRAFSECATITADLRENERDACVSAMLDKKMTCSDLSVPNSGPSPVPRKIRVFRSR